MYFQHHYSPRRYQLLFAEALDLTLWKRRNHWTSSFFVCAFLLFLYKPAASVSSVPHTLGANEVALLPQSSSPVISDIIRTNPPCLSLLALSGGVEWQKERHDWWLRGISPPLTSSSHTLTVQRVRGGSRGRRGDAGVISGFGFHLAVIVGGGMDERRWGLWERCEDKEQRGSPVVSLTTPKCIFPVLLSSFLSALLII